MQSERRGRFPLRHVDEEEFERLKEDYIRQKDNRECCFLETIKTPFRCNNDHHDESCNVEDRFRVTFIHRELVIKFAEERFEKRITLKYENVWDNIKLILSQNGCLMIWLPLNKQNNHNNHNNLNNHKSNVGNKLMLDGTVETEEYRQMRKYLKQLERINFPDTFCTRITKRKNNHGTKVQFKFNCRGFLKEELQVLVKEAEAKITIEGRQERKNEFGVSMQNFKRELVKLPIKMFDFKQLRTTFTEEKWLLIEIPTIVDLMPTVRQNVDEEIEVKRA
jgi:hypothetical protein